MTATGGTLSPDHDREQLIRALRALGKMLREEYPAAYSLAQIASTWGHGVVDAGDIEAVAAVEHLLDES